MFSRKLKQLRHDNDISKDMLAKKLDVTKKVVSDWEAGITMPNIHNIIKISEMFSVSTDYLLKDDTKDTQFSYYTKEQEKKRHMNRQMIGAIVFIMIAIAGMLSMLIVAIVSPITYNDFTNGLVYHGFRAYYYQYVEVRTTFIISLVVLIVAVILLIVPFEYFEKLFLRIFRKKI